MKKIIIVLTCGLTFMIGCMSTPKKYHYTTYQDKDLINNASDENIQKVKSLLESGAYINAQDEYGYSALIMVAGNRQVETVKLLIQNKADVNLADKKGSTALMDVLAQPTKDEWIEAVKRTSDIVHLLLEAGANVYAKNKKGETALILAWNSPLEIYKIFLEARSDVNAEDNKGETALFRTFDIKKIKLLLEFGANVNHINKECKTVFETHGKYMDDETYSLLRDAESTSRPEDQSLRKNQCETRKQKETVVSNQTRTNDKCSDKCSSLAGTGPARCLKQSSYVAQTECLNLLNLEIDSCMRGCFSR